MVNDGKNNTVNHVKISNHVVHVLCYFYRRSPSYFNHSSPWFTVPKHHGIKFNTMENYGFLAMVYQGRVQQHTL